LNGETRMLKEKSKDPKNQNSNSRGTFHRFKNPSEEIGGIQLVTSKNVSEGGQSNATNISTGNRTQSHLNQADPPSVVEIQVNDGDLRGEPGGGSGNGTVNSGSSGVTFKVGDDTVEKDLEKLKNDIKTMNQTSTQIISPENTDNQKNTSVLNDLTKPLKNVQSTNQSTSLPQALTEKHVENLDTVTPSINTMSPFQHQDQHSSGKLNITTSLKDLQQLSMDGKVGKENGVNSSLVPLQLQINQEKVPKPTSVDGTQAPQEVSSEAKGDQKIEPKDNNFKVSTDEKVQSVDQKVLQGSETGKADSPKIPGSEDSKVIIDNKVHLSSNQDHQLTGSQTKTSGNLTDNTKNAKVTDQEMAAIIKSSSTTTRQTNNKQHTPDKMRNESGQKYNQVGESQDPLEDELSRLKRESAMFDMYHSYERKSSKADGFRTGKSTHQDVNRPPLPWSTKRKEISMIGEKRSISAKQKGEVVNAALKKLMPLLLQGILKKAVMRKAGLAAGGRAEVSAPDHISDVNIRHMAGYGQAGFVAPPAGLEVGAVGAAFTGGGGGGLGGLGSSEMLQSLIAKKFGGGSAKGQVIMQLLGGQNMESLGGVMGGHAGALLGMHESVPAILSDPPPRGGCSPYVWKKDCVPTKKTTMMKSKPKVKIEKIGTTNFEINDHSQRHNKENRQIEEKDKLEVSQSEESDVEDDQSGDDDSDDADEIKDNVIRPKSRGLPNQSHNEPIKNIDIKGDDKEEQSLINRGEFIKDSTNTNNYHDTPSLDDEHQNSDITDHSDARTTVSLTPSQKEDSDDNEDLGTPDRGFAKRADKGVVIVPFGNRNYMKQEIGNEWNKLSGVSTNEE